MRRLKSWIAVLAPLSACPFLASPLGAQPKEAGPDAAQSPAGPSRVVIEKGKGQRPLVIELDESLIRARACADSKDCDLSSATSLRPPEAVRANTRAAKIETVDLDRGKRLAVVRLKARAGREYVVLIASPDAKSEAPSVVFSGYVGRDGEASTELEITGPAGHQKVRVVERSRLCSAEVVTSARALDPASLTLRAEAPLDPIGSARASMSSIPAVLDPSPVARYQLLASRGSSSGRGSLAVDGDPKTAWTSDEGSGAKPFVSLSTPSGLPLLGLDVSVGESEASPPRSLAIVTDRGVYSVSIPAPSEPGAKPASRTYAVTFPKPIDTTCVAVVIDQDPDRGSKKRAKEAPRARASILEIAARTSLDGKSLETLAGEVGTGGPTSALAMKILEAEGGRGIRAIADAYPKLEPTAQDRLRRIVDASDCEDKLAFYVPLLASVDRQESDRARDRVRRCGKEAGAALLAALNAATLEDVRAIYAEEAALVSPELATPTLVEKLVAAHEDPAARKTYRRALTKGALRAAGVRAIDAVLALPTFASAPLVARIDVLRALGPSIRDAKRAPRAFADAASAAKDFREQYLLIGPAAELGLGDDAAAIEFLRRALDRSASPHLRARAAELAAPIEKLRPDLLRAIDDDQVRVREAALLALTVGKGGFDGTVAGKLAERLEGDPWTFVRLAAAFALGAGPKSAAIDDRIAKAIDQEEQPSVRAEMARALGARGAKRPVLRERAFDDREALTVRVRAIEALGAVCDREALGPLTELAQKGRMPLFESDRKLAAAAVHALVRLGPKDLKTRLAPLVSEGASPDVSEITKRALAALPGASGATCR